MLARLVEESAKEADAVVVSDYGAGVLCPETLAALGRHAASGGTVCVDSRFGLANFEGFTVCKPNAPELAAFTGLPVVPALRRVKPTETQTHFGRSKRLENLRGAFDLSRRGRRWAKARPPGAVLVDDVLTTGATADECAATLRDSSGKPLVWAG